MGIENVIIDIAERLKKNYPNRDIFMSNTLKGKKIHIKGLSGEVIRELTACKKGVIFRGIEIPKKSWYKVNNPYRTYYNAGMIEFCKFLPYFPQIDIKNPLLKSIGIKLGKDVTIAPRVQFDYFYPELISIDDNTLIGDGAKLWTHEFGPDYFAIGEIKINKNCYIGSEALIGPLSEIKVNSKINARAIVIYGKDFKE